MVLPSLVLPVGPGAHATILSAGLFHLCRICQMNNPSGSETFAKQALTDHLRELRSCLIVSFVSVFIGFCISYTVIRPIGSWFFRPLTEVLPVGTTLIFTSYQEGFFFI